MVIEHVTVSLVGSVTEIVYRSVSVDVSSSISQLIGKFTMVGGCNKEKKTKILCSSEHVDKHMI